MAIAKPPGGGPHWEEDFYPTRDGKPMGETDKHRDEMIYLIEALKAHYSQQPNIYVSGNNFIYFEEGNPKARISPDTYVVFGIPMRQRDSYMAWKEGYHLPAVVFEITSRKTRKEDTDTKRPLYEQILRVPEYFLFDPTGDYLKPRLQGYRLGAGRYEILLPVDNRLYSEELNLDLVQRGDALRLYDPERGEWLVSTQESMDLLAEQTRRAEEEARAREAETRRADAEAQRAEAEAQARAAEARARAEAEAEVARLRAEIEALRRKS